MKIFENFLYLRTIFVLLPLGIGLVYFGIEGLTKSVDDLPYFKGVVSDYHLRMMYYESCNCQIETLIIHIDDFEKPFTTPIKKHREIISPIINIGDSIEFWLWDKSMDFEFRQVKLNGEMVIPYNPTLLLYYGFLIAGIPLTALSLFHIIKSPDDLFGKKQPTEESGQV